MFFNSPVSIVYPYDDDHINTAPEPFGPSCATLPPSRVLLFLALCLSLNLRATDPLPCECEIRCRRMDPACWVPCTLGTHAKATTSLSIIRQRVRRGDAATEATVRACLQGHPSTLVSGFFSLFIINNSERCRSLHVQASGTCRDLSGCCARHLGSVQEQGKGMAHQRFSSAVSCMHAVSKWTDSGDIVIVNCQQRYY